MLKWGVCIDGVQCRALIVKRAQVDQAVDLTRKQQHSYE
jgi:hypothetical protein